MTPPLRAVRRTPDPESTELGVLRAILEEIRGMRADMRERRQQPAIEGDVDAAVHARVAALGLKQFVTRDVIALRAKDPALEHALSSAFIDTGEQLGKCFARLYKRRLMQRGEKRGKHGRLWGV